MPSGFESGASCLVCSRVGEEFHCELASLPCFPLTKIRGLDTLLRMAVVPGKECAS